MNGRFGSVGFGSVRFGSVRFDSVQGTRGNVTLVTTLTTLSSIMAASDEACYQYYRIRTFYVEF